jgi:hypothetical protein
MLLEAFLKALVAGIFGASVIRGKPMHHHLIGLTLECSSSLSHALPAMK